MPSLYQIALMLTRLFGAIYLVVGSLSIVGVVLISILAINSNHTSELASVGMAVTAYLSEFGSASVIGGIGLLLLSKKIAKFAAKD
jgi:hypothetical protein